MENLGLPAEPGMEIPYFNDQEHGQLLLSLENGINDINSTSGRAGNTNQVSSSHEAVLCTIDAHLHVKGIVIIGFKPYNPRNRVILDIGQTLGTSPASNINRKKWQR